MTTMTTMRMTSPKSIINITPRTDREHQTNPLRVRCLRNSPLKVRHLPDYPKKGTSVPNNRPMAKILKTDLPMRKILKTILIRVRVCPSQTRIDLPKAQIRFTERNTAAKILKRATAKMTTMMKMRNSIEKNFSATPLLV